MQPTTRDATRDDAVAVAVADLLAEMGYPTTAQAAGDHIARFEDDPASRLQVAASADDGVVGLVATPVVPRLDDDRSRLHEGDFVVRY